MSKIILEFDGIVYDGSNLEELEEWLSEQGYIRHKNWTEKNMQYKDEENEKNAYLTSPNKGDLTIIWLDNKFEQICCNIVTNGKLKFKEECSQQLDVPIEQPKQVLINDNDQIINRLLDIIEKVVSK